MSTAKEKLSNQLKELQKRSLEVAKMLQITTKEEETDAFIQELIILENSILAIEKALNRLDNPTLKKSVSSIWSKRRMFNIPVQFFEDGSICFMPNETELEERIFRAYPNQEISIKEISWDIASSMSLPPDTRSTIKEALRRIEFVFNKIEDGRINNDNSLTVALNLPKKEELNLKSLILENIITLNDSTCNKYPSIYIHENERYYLKFNITNKTEKQPEVISYITFDMVVKVLYDEIELK